MQLCAKTVLQASQGDGRRDKVSRTASLKQRHVQQEHILCSLAKRARRQDAACTGAGNRGEATLGSSCMASSKYAMCGLSSKALPWPTCIEPLRVTATVTVVSVLMQVRR